MLQTQHNASKDMWYAAAEVLKSLKSVMLL